IQNCQEKKLKFCEHAAKSLCTMELSSSGSIQGYFMSSMPQSAGYETAESTSLAVPPAVAGRQRRASHMPAVLVLMLAFLLASTPVRNSDFWLHLATGKALIEGRYRFGLEPFTTGQRWIPLADAPGAAEFVSFTSGEAPAYWANPAWLYD